MLRFVVALLAVVAAAVPAASSAAEFPSRPVRLVLGTPAGSGADLMLRAISDDLGAELGQPVVIENRPGAEGILAARIVALAPADGYTLLVALRSQFVATPLLNADAGYDPLRDYAPVTLLSHQRLAVVVTPGLPVASLRELVEKSRADPDAFDYASANTTFQLSTEAFLGHTGARMRMIPYGGVPQALRAVMSGEVQVALLNVSVVAEAVRDGRVRALAIAAPVRSPDLPGVPTLAEAGYANLDLPLWFGVAVPARTPSTIVSTLNAAFLRTLARPAVRERLLGMGIEPDPGTPEAFAARVVRETSESATLVRELGLGPR